MLSSNYQGIPVIGVSMATVMVAAAAKRKASITAIQIKVRTEVCF